MALCELRPGNRLPIATQLVFLIPFSGIERGACEYTSSGDVSLSNPPVTLCSKVRFFLNYVCNMKGQTIPEIVRVWKLDNRSETSLLQLVHLICGCLCASE